jgi:1-aminocyclopropane-1-carboxylate deaminase
VFYNQIDIVTEKIALGAKLDGEQALFIKREDEIHRFVSGNKFRKLKYNILKAQEDSFDGLLTFGGAYSNHIAAVAYAGQQCGLKTIGIIRGDELEGQITKNPTLLFAKDHGMQLQFISRNMYRKKNEPDFIKNLQRQFGEYYVLPEGGTNGLAVKGCEEILTDAEKEYDYICTTVGTGGTMAGLINASLPHQTVVGFSALKGVFQREVLEKFALGTNFYLTDAYCFGGYAKIDSELIRFINEFKEHTGIPLDPVYTSKMMFGIMDLLKKGYFRENSRILAIHTGGLQGIAGMNRLLKKKNLQQINL